MIIIGNSLKALLYAVINDAKIIIVHHIEPNEFRFLPPKNFPIYEKLGFENHIVSFSKWENGHVSKTKFGMPEWALWQHLYLLLGLNGNILYGDLVSSIYFDNTGKLFVYALNQQYDFVDEFHVFDIHDEQSFQMKTGRLKTYNVYDGLKIHHGIYHNYDFVQYEKFKIFFILSSQTARKLQKGTAILHQRCRFPHTENNDIIYSKFILENLLGKIDAKGNARYDKKKKPTAEVISRITVPIYKDVEFQHENVKFISADLKKDLLSYKKELPNWEYYSQILKEGKNET